MIWLIGNRGMLGTEVEALLGNHKKSYIASDQEVDITNIDALQKFSAGRSISWIINCAGYTAVDRAEDEPELAFKINAAGPLNIAKIAKGKNAKLIHISTDYVFDGTKERVYTETDIPNPMGVYAASKHKGEVNIVEALDEHFIIRSAWLYGRHGHNFVNTMLRLFREKKEIGVVADQYGSPTYAPDLAEAIIAIISSNATGYGIYHFTNEGKITWYDFACQIYRIAVEKRLLTHDVRIFPISTADYPAKARRPKNAYLSKEKIIHTFGISVKQG
jgi:dTDP-4-dehydrorhamnose reductase